MGQDIVDNNPQQGIYYTIIKLLYRGLKAIRQNSVLFLICLAVGIVPFIVFGIKQLNTYEATFTVSYDDLVRKIYGDRLSKLNTLLRQDNYSKVGKLLGLDTQIVSSIITVKGENILGEELSKDINTDHVPFIVRVKMKEKKYTAAIQNGIVAFLETGNDYMADRKIVRLKGINDEIAFIDKQIEMMDSLKRRYNAASLMERMEKTSSPGSVYEFTYELYKKRQDLYVKQQMPSGIQVVDDAIVAKPTRKSLIFMGFLGILVGTFFFVIIAGFILPVLRYKEV